jgi:hypothetical protein
VCDLLLKLIEDSVAHASDEPFTSPNLQQRRSSTGTIVAEDGVLPQLKSLAICQPIQQDSSLSSISSSLDDDNDVIIEAEVPIIVNNSEEISENTVIRPVPVAGSGDCYGLPNISSSLNNNIVFISNNRQCFISETLERIRIRIFKEFRIRIRLLKSSESGFGSDPK